MEEKMIMLDTHAPISDPPRLPFIRRVLGSMGKQAEVPFIWRLPIWLVIALALLSAACTQKKCHFNSDCAEGQRCFSGECYQVCSDDEQCASGYSCQSGRCQAVALCSGDADCTDGGSTDAGVDETIDMTPGQGDLDMSLPADIGLEQDASLVSMDQGVLTLADMMIEADIGAFFMDAGPAATGFDLSGLYTVSSRVVVATGGDFEEEQIERTIVRLSVLDGTRYRLEMYDLDGNREYIIPNVDLIAPEGPGRYQYEYSSRTPSRGNCDLVETRFERGRHMSSATGIRFTGTQERRFQLSGENCAADPYLVRLETSWVELP